MQIKTITCHDVYNSGASLQAYALQTYLASLGHEVEIIDYKPGYLSNHFNLLTISNPKYNSNCFVKIAYLSAKLPSRLFAFKKKKAFDNFRKKYLKLTKSRYYSYDDLKENPPEADIYIAGSDQIWNFSFPNGKDPSFYLSFAPDNKIRASYAASFATETIPLEYSDFLSKMLRNLDYVSVREFDATKIVEAFGINSDCVCDPVFLLEQDKWSSLCTKSFKENYILVYDFDNSSNIREIVKILSDKFNLKIYSYGAKLGYEDHNFQFAGPLEFLSLIRSSQIVVSNSFHATAFSLLFKKEFYIVPRSENINTRMVSLLGFLGLSNRIINEQEFVISNSIDYSSDILNTNLMNFIRASKEYLHEICRKN